MLFPAAGLDPSRAAEYYEVQALVEQLAYAGNEAARRYINGQIDAAAAAAWLERYALMPRDRAAQRVRFFDQYRSYVINYNLGKDMVRQLHRVASGRGRKCAAALGGVHEAAVVPQAALDAQVGVESAESQTAAPGRRPALRVGVGRLRLRYGERGRSLGGGPAPRAIKQ